MTRIASLLALSVATLLSLPSASSLFAQRIDTEWHKGWRFIKADVGPAAPVDPAWSAVEVPHTWNAQDGQNGREADPGLRDGYFRGACWYARDFAADATWKGRRVTLRFEASSIVTDVWLNDVHLGQHRGAFAAFAFELTPHLKFTGTNTLRIRVDNSQFEDVPPLQGDFTIFGGLYRPVHLIVTDPINITPLHHGTSGVFLTLRSITDDEAEVEMRTFLSSSLPGSARADLQTVVLDAAGVVVARERAPVRIPPGESAEFVQTVRIPKPHRWQGREDPYLYTVRVGLHRNGHTVDLVEQPLGLRTIVISDEHGVMLNGRPYATRGVNRHQDRIDKGWAVSRADHEEDIAMIMEMGCTSLRLAHYQQSDFVHDLCDRAGLVVWQEVPLVDRINSLPEFAASARQQLTEMILQGYNHPSLCFWGLYNELNAAWAEKPGPAPDALITGLRRLANSLDPSRPTVAASWIRENSESIHVTPQHMAWNVYPGWYWGTPEDFSRMVEDLCRLNNRARIGISEYGAGASVAQHWEDDLAPPANTGSKFHPEEWQTHLHCRLWAQMKDNPRLWGTWVWAMFDFASDGRDEGDMPGRNDKGLVTYDRRTRKDAFYFYQANWTTGPMARIVAGRMDRRTRATTEIQVFSNCAKVEAFLNGVSLGVASPDAVNTFFWPGVTLRAGENRIEIVATAKDGTIVRDTCVWMLRPTAGG